MPYKQTKFLFFFAMAACVGLRIYLKLQWIDPYDGFYLDGNPFLVTFFNVLLIAACAGILLTAFLGGKKNAPPVAVYAKPVNGLAMLSGIGALPVAGLLVLAQVEALGDVEFQGSVAMGALLMLLRFICLGAAPLVSAGLLIWVGAKAQGDSSSYRIHGVLALAPLVWHLANLLSLYMGYTAIRSVSDQQLEIVMLIVMAPYLLAWGRVYSGTEPDKGMRHMMAFGLCYALLALTVSTGVLIAACFGMTADMAMAVPSAGFHFFFGLYTASLCCRTAPPSAEPQT